MSLQNKKVLVVVEDQFLGHTLEDFLSQQGYSVDCAPALPTQSAPEFHAVIASIQAVTGKASNSKNLAVCCRTNGREDQLADWKVFCEPIPLHEVLSSISTTIQ